MNRPEKVVDIYLQPGDLRFGERNARMRTVLGSCVSITMWHPERLIGGMCHYMLPTRPLREGSGNSSDGKYADNAVVMMLDEAERRKTDPQEYVYKMFGAGYMFEHGAKPPCSARACDQVIGSCHDVSCKNSLVGHQLLLKHGLSITAEHVGGNGYHEVVFDVWNGDVWVRQVQAQNRQHLP